MTTLEFECRNCYNTITMQIVSDGNNNNNITAFWDDKYWIVASGYGSFILYQKTNHIDESDPTVLNFDCPICNSKLYVDICSSFPVTSSKQDDNNNDDGSCSSWIVNTIVGKLSMLVRSITR